jgi:hypothetical protein
LLLYIIFAVNKRKILEFIVTTGYALLFIVLIRIMPFFRISGFHKNTLPAIFALKLMAGLMVYFVYTRYYPDRSTADIFKYFDDSKVMYDALFTNPADFFQMLTGINNDSPYFEMYYNQMNYWYRVYESNIYNDSHTIIRLNALLRLFSFGYYNVHTVFMCFFSLAGLTGIYRFFAAALSDRKPILLIAVFLLPSVLFWGSGVLKEGLLFFGLGMLLWHTQLLLNKKKILLSLFMIAGALILLLYTKFYIITLMLPLLVAYVWCGLRASKHTLLKYLTVMGGFLFLGLNLHFIFPQYDFVHILVHKQHDFLALSQSVQSGSSIAMQPLEDSFLSLLINIPEALYNSMFLPWFFQGGSPLILMAGLENLLVMLFAMFCVFMSKFRINHSSLFWLCVFFSLGIFALTGLTTPVVGAIVRYKVPALPFLIIALAMLIDKEKLSKHLPFLKKWLGSPTAL